MTNNSTLSFARELLFAACLLWQVVACRHLTCGDANAAEVKMTDTVVGIVDPIQGHVKLSYSSPEQYGIGLQSYLKAVSSVDISAAATVTEIYVTEDLDVEEITRTGIWSSQDETVRGSYYATAVRGGQTSWMYAEDYLSSPQGIVRWKHPGFPGEVVFSHRRAGAWEALNSELIELFDPRFGYAAILRLLPLGEFSEQNKDTPTIVIHASAIAKTLKTGADGPTASADDRIEIALSAENGFLPSSMVRVGMEGVSADRMPFKNGTGLSFEYQRRPFDGRSIFMPVKIIERTVLKEEATGRALREYRFSYSDDHELSSSLSLTLPATATAINVETDQSFPLAASSSIDVRDLIAIAPEHISIASSPEAALSMQSYASGQSPAIPDEFIDRAKAELSKSTTPIPQRARTTSRWLLILGINIAIVATLALILFVRFFVSRMSRR
jgi:hypothetical protein